MLISFAIPAHNEAGELPRTLGAIHAAARAAGVEYEIVVADDASTDATVQVARERGARVVTIDRRHIAAARNAAAAASLGDVLVFVDADTAINESVLRAALAALERGFLGGGASVRFDEPVPRYARLILPPINALFRLLRVSGGCFIFCRRDGFDRAGGWDETIFASEEIAFATALKRHGRFVTLRETVLTSGRKLRTHTARELFGPLLPLLFRGRTMLESRDRLGIWYAPRRADPAASARATR